MQETFRCLKELENIPGSAESLPRCQRIKARRSIQKLHVVDFFFFNREFQVKFLDAYLLYILMEWFDTYPKYSFILLVNTSQFKTDKF